MDERRIEARFSLNFLNKPRVVVDRVTGAVTIDGFGTTGFAGECEPEATDAAPKF